MKANHFSTLLPQKEVFCQYKYNETEHTTSSLIILINCQNIKQFRNKNMIKQQNQNSVPFIEATYH